MKNLIGKTKGSYEVNNPEALRAKVFQNPAQQKRPIKTCVAYRYYIASLGFLSYCIPTSHRVGLAIAIVNMSNYTRPVQQNTSTTSCPVFNDSEQNSSKTMAGGEFDWDAEVQGYILSASFLGCVLVLFIAGLLVDAIGAKWILLWSNVVCGATMLLSPILSRWHVYALIAAHFVRSVAQGFTVPAIFKLMSNWTPRGERGFISSFIVTGNSVGSMLGGIASGYLCEQLGWQYVFYFFGGVGCLFSIQLAVTFYETPRDHPKISETELNYITEDQAIHENEKKLPTPWLKILTSVPTYAVMYAQFGASWTLFYFTTVHPVYVSSILHFSISQNGLLLALPLVLKVAAILFASSVSDWLFRKKIVGVDKLRKGCNFIGCLGCSLSFLGIYLSGCSKLGNVLFLTIAVISGGLTTPGCLIAVVDMAPKFSGTLKGIAGSAFNMSGFIIPIMVGHLTKEQIIGNWHTVFLICIVVVMSSGIVFAVFGSAEVQPWNFAEQVTKEASAAGEITARKDVDASEIGVKGISPISEIKDMYFTPISK